MLEGERTYTGLGLLGFFFFPLCLFSCLFKQKQKTNLRVAQMVKNLPAMQESWVQSLGWEDPLEKGMVTYFSILAWRIPWTKEPGGLQSIGTQIVGHD